MSNDVSTLSLSLSLSLSPLSLPFTISLARVERSSLFHLLYSSSTVCYDGGTACVLTRLKKWEVGGNALASKASERECRLIKERKEREREEANSNKHVQVLVSRYSTLSPLRTQKKYISPFFEKRVIFCF